MELEKASRKPPSDLTVYELFLRGRELRLRLNRNDNGRAREFLEKAIELDRRFAAAYTQLAITYYTAYALGWEPDLGQAGFDRVESLLLQTLALDSSSPTALALMGSVHLRRRQYDEAIQTIKRAVAINPNDAETYARLADAQTFAGAPGDAIRSMEIHMRLDPFYTPNREMYLGRAFYYAGHDDRAVGPLLSCARRAPDFWPCHRYLAAAYGQLGRNAEAQNWAREYMRLVPDNSLTKLRQTTLYRRSEDVERLIGGLRKAGFPER